MTARDDDPSPPSSGSSSSARRVDLVLTPFGDARRLATACAIAGLQVDVVAGASGCVVVPIGGQSQARDVASALSRLAPTAEVVHLVHADERVVGHRWLGGAQQDDVPAGLALAGAPAVVEDLLLGRSQASQLPDVETSRGLDRLTAVRRARTEGTLVLPGWAGRLEAWQPYARLLAAGGALVLLTSEVLDAVDGDPSWWRLVLWSVAFVVVGRAAWRGLRARRAHRSS